jgi:hypothetical protein
MKGMHLAYFLFVLVVDAAAAVLAPIMDIRFHNDAAFQIAYGSAAIVTFLGLLPIALDSNISWFRFRELVASGFVVTYLLLVTSAAFFHTELPEGNITPAFVNNFTTLTGVVVGAYFTTRAVENVADSVTGGKTKAPSPDDTEAGRDTRA